MSPKEILLYDFPSFDIIFLLHPTSVPINNRIRNGECQCEKGSTYRFLIKLLEDHIKYINVCAKNEKKRKRIFWCMDNKDVIRTKWCRRRENFYVDWISLFCKINVLDGIIMVQFDAYIFRIFSGFSVVDV